MSQKKLIWFAYASLFFLGLSDNIRGPLFPEIIKEFSLSNSESSLFFALSSGMIIPAGFLSSFLLKKVGSVKALRIALFLSVLGLFGIAILPKYFLILGAAIIFGFAFGIMGVTQNVMVIEAAPHAELQKWQSGLHSMYGLASLVAPMVVLFLYHVHPVWRISFYFIAVLGLLLFLITFLIEKKGASLVQEASPELSSTGFEQFLFACIIASYVAAEILAGTRIAQFSRESFQMSFSQGTQLTSLFFVMLFVGRFLFIFWHPKISLKKQMLISLSGSFVLSLFGLFVHPLGLALSALLMAPFYPMSMTVAGRLFKNELHKVTSLAIALSGATIMLVQLVVGFLGDQFGLQVALLMGPFFSLFAMALIFQYRRSFQRDLP